MQEEGPVGGPIGGLPLVESVGASLEVLISQLCRWAWSEKRVGASVSRCHWNRAVRCLVCQLTETKLLVVLSSTATTSTWSPISHALAVLLSRYKSQAPS